MNLIARQLLGGAAVLGGIPIVGRGGGRGGPGGGRGPGAGRGAGGPGGGRGACRT